MSKFSNTSSYTLSGDATATFYSITVRPAEGSSDLSTLSTNNYPSGDTTPNQDNQHVFMNQNLSWWLSELNAGTVKYTPISNNVNWSFTNVSGSSFHIDRSVTNVIIPNKTLSASMDPKSKKSTAVFEAKNGLQRTDTYTF